MKPPILPWLAAMVLLPLATRAQLLQPEVLFTFTKGVSGFSELLRGSDGSFYATCSGSTNDKGAVVKITTDGTLRTLFAFNGTNGAVSNLFSGAGLTVGQDGNFYGTTHRGGDNDLGTVFKITPDGTLTSLVSFNGTNGAEPRAALALGNDGRFYGTTYRGGLNGYGTVFRMTTNGALTTLVSFNGATLAGANSSRPESVLTLGSDGYFYGTTSGTNGYGTVFRMTTNGVLTSLVKFDGFNGRYPAPRLVQGADGNFYGTTSQEGNAPWYYGTVFKMTPNGSLTTLIVFDAFTQPGTSPRGGLTFAADGSFYGTTATGHSAYSPGGTVFQITTNGTVTTLTGFTNYVRGIGIYPLTRLVYGEDGNLYGTTTAGGDDYQGAVFRMTPSGVMTRLYSPLTAPYGSAPNELTLGSDGNFYGTTSGGGVGNAGTVFRMTSDGTLTTLVSSNFNASGPRVPRLTEGVDGCFYGTLPSGVVGVLAPGTIFKVVKDGTFIRQFSFDRTNGAGPMAELTLDSSGNFYGTATGGGTNNAGTVFKRTTDGVVRALASFNRTNGAEPRAGLTSGMDGNFYGTTYSGGARDAGTVFKITPDGMLTTIASFTGTNGYSPQVSLTLGKDGFYGTTRGSGASGGTVFRITPDGQLRTFYAFAARTNGLYPESALTLGPDGNFYGTTSEGGATEGGTVFKLTQDGTLTTLIKFNRTNGLGWRPNGGLTLGDDGHLYGSTLYGGSAGLGTIFRLTTGFPKSPSIVTHPTSKQTFIGSNVTFTVEATTANPPLRYQWRFNFADLPGATNDSLTIADPQPANLGYYQVVVTDGGGGSTPSAVVTLSLIDALFITYELLANGQFRLGFVSGPGTTFNVLVSTNLTAWSVLGPAVELLPGQFQFTDDASANQPARFYRLWSP